MNPYLSARQISKSFWVKKSRVLILEKLDLSVAKGEFVAIIGSSGCGKSTLLELFAGITSPESGEIILESCDITGKSGHLGYMPQDDLLFPWLTTVENALIPVRVKSLDLKQGRKEVEELLPVFGLENHAGLLPYQLSGGLRQRVALLRTYMTGSRLLLLDEPLASLDAITRMQMQDWLISIKEQLDLTILMVTHDIGEAIKVASRIGLMSGKPGRFTQFFELDSVIKDDPLKADKLKHEITATLC